MFKDSKQADYETLRRSSLSKGVNAENQDRSLDSCMGLKSQLDNSPAINAEWGLPPTNEGARKGVKTAAQEQKNTSNGLKADVLQVGHSLSYVGLFLFTFVLYFRPYELFSALSSLTSLAFWIAVPTLIIFFTSQFSLEGNLTARPREVNLVLLFVLAALISMPLAINPGDSWEAFNKEFIKAVLMFIVIVNVVRTERRLRGVLFLALAVSCFLSVKAVIDYSRGNFTISGDRIGGAVGGMFGNPNDMALHLVTMLPVAITFFFMRRNPFARIGYLLCSVLIVAGIVVSFSRGGFLGLLAAGGLLAWKLGRRHRLAVVLCGVLALVAFVAVAPAEYGSRMGSIANSSRDLTGSFNARRELLFRSILVTLRHPLLGVGMGNFHILSIHEAVSHNAYTQVSSEMGIYALVIYFWFIVTPLRGLRRIESETMGDGAASRFYYFSVGLQAALAGYMVSSFFASVAYNFYVYYLVGYAVCVRRMYMAARAEDAKQSKQ